MKRSNFTLLLLTLFTVACQPQVDRFTLNGQITDAEGKTAYLDRLSLDKISVIDSVKLDKEGKFSFNPEAPLDCFEFYRLRVDNKTVNFTIDSIETVTVNADLPTMSLNYSIQGSSDCSKLKEIVIRQTGLLRDIKNVVSNYKSPDPTALNNKVKELVDVFKSELMSDYIFPDPSSPCAYYVLFMSIDGQMLFSPQTDRQDAKTFAAVATQMEIHYPEAVRTAHIRNVALKGMNQTSPSKNNLSVEQKELIRTINNMVEETGLIDIELPDYEGRMHKLSETKGKVTLLDFTAYKTDYSPNYNLLLRRLYDKFAGQGFEIYQVSVDSDESFWLNSVTNLPWICVYDEESLKSRNLKLYNVNQIPAVFLIDREGNIVDRPNDTDELESKIAKLLD